MMLDMAGRRVKLLNGKHHQTVRICTEEGIHGRYQWGVRLRAPFLAEGELRSREFDTPEQIVDFLENERGATVIMRDGVDCDPRQRRRAHAEPCDREPATGEAARFWARAFLWAALLGRAVEEDPAKLMVWVRVHTVVLQSGGWYVEGEDDEDNDSDAELFSLGEGSIESALHAVYRGESPDLVLIELYANAER